MSIYLLVVIVALTTIFGLAHSLTARETLHLEDVFTWAVESLQQQFELHDFGNRGDLNENQVLDALEICIDQLEAPNLVKNKTDTVEKIQASQTETFESLTMHLVDEIQITSTDVDNTSNFQTRSENNVTPEQSPSPTSNRKFRSRTTLESEDEILEAMKSSLQKLISAANSGKFNGAQLYDVLLQETAAHDRLASNQQNRNNNENEVDSSNSTVLIEEIHESDPVVETGEDKPKMYFGESPLEYVPHQKE